MKMIYPAVFHPEAEGGYSVDFPDLLGCVTEGDTLVEAVAMAEDALGIYLYSLKVDKEPYPPPSDPAGIKVENGSFISLVEYDEIAYIKRTDNRAVKKNAYDSCLDGYNGKRTQYQFFQCPAKGA